MRAHSSERLKNQMVIFKTPRSTTPAPSLPKPNQRNALDPTALSTTNDLQLNLHNDTPWVYRQNYPKNPSVPIKNIT